MRTRLQAKQNETKQNGIVIQRFVPRRGSYVVTSINIVDQRNQCNTLKHIIIRVGDYRNILK